MVKLWLPPLIWQHKRIILVSSYAYCKERCSDRVSKICYCDIKMDIRMQFVLSTILISTFYKIISTSNLKNDIYVKNKNISCCPLEDHGLLTEIPCALQCTNLDQVCSGFSIIDSVCNLCLVCLGSSNLKTVTSGFARNDEFKGR